MMFRSATSVGMLTMCYAFAGRLMHFEKGSLKKQTALKKFPYRFTPGLSILVFAMYCLYCTLWMYQ